MENKNNKFLIGSKYFFSCYEDFIAKDTDELEFVNTADFSYLRQISGRGYDLFQVRIKPDKQEYIDYALKSNLGMVVGKFLVPEAAAAMGLSVADLRQLSPLIAKLDDKHKYEEIIYNAYLENNSFTLTPQQRAAAYQSYKASRNIN